MVKSCLKLVVPMLVFGSIGIFVRKISLPTMELVFYRVLIAVIFMLALFAYQRKKPFRCGKKQLYLAGLSGVIMGMNWLLFFQALRYTTVAAATMTYYLAPILMLLSAPFILGERLTMRQIGAAALAPLGLACIVFSASEAAEITYRHGWGIACGLGSALFYALLILCNKKLEKIGNLDRTMIQLSAATVALSPVLIFYHDFTLVAENLPMLLILGIVHTGIACYFYFAGLKETPTQLTAVLSYIDPVSAVFFAAVFLGEALSFSQIMGTVIVLGSTYLCGRMQTRPAAALVKATASRK